MLNRATAAKYLNAMAVSGQAEVRALGPAKVFYSSHRLPLADLMSLSSDLILILDDGLYVLHANDTLLYHFGLDAGEVKGRRLDVSPIAPLLSGTDICKMLQTLDGVEHDFDCEIERTGTTRYYRGRALPLVLEAGARGVALILEDTTGERRHQQELETCVRERTRELEETNAALEREVEEHRCTEKRLTASRKTIRQILETTPNLVYVYSLETVRLRYANRSLAAILGYTPESSWTDEGSEIIPIVHPDDVPLLDGHRNHLSTASDGEVKEIELRLRHALGHFLTLRCRELVFKRDLGGRPLMVIGTAEDVTERRMAADALRTASLQLQMLNGITRHEILEQLDVLAGSLALLRNGVAPSSGDEFLDRAELAAETIRRQIGFTRDYQNIGAQPLAWQRVNGVIDRAAVEFDQVAIEASACNVEVYADRLFEKVVYALIDNAVRHGETVTIIRFSCLPLESGLAIVCEDDGVGIPADQKEQIFARAFGRNSGYGLFFAREILTITGLTIREIGVPGAGARFEIVVPPGLFRSA